LIWRAVAAGKGVLAGMPLAMANTVPLLSRIRAPRDIWYLARAMAHHRRDLAIGRHFRFLHERPDMTGPQAALTYVLANSGVSAAIFGATRIEHLRENLAATDLVMSDELMRRIRSAQGALTMP
jgi:aryl-alcohol dehydrogenase-like predicted oxidoreductase